MDNGNKFPVNNDEYLSAQRDELDAIIPLNQTDKIGATTAEDYLIDYLSEDYTDEELNAKVEELLIESQSDLELARFLIKREQLIARRRHPTAAATNPQEFQQNLDTLIRQIDKRKQELNRPDIG